MDQETQNADARDPSTEFGGNDARRSNNATPGETYARLWEDFATVIRDFDAGLARILREEKAAFGIDSDWRCAFDVRSRANETIAKVAKHVVARLVSHARDQLTPDGCSSIRIPLSDYISKYLEGVAATHDGTHLRDARPERFSPIALWNEIVAEYGGPSGQERTFAQSAQALVDIFALHGDTPVEIKNGKRIVLTLGVSLDDFEARHGRKTLRADSVDDVVNAIANLVTFSAWAQDDTGLRAGLQRAAERWGWGRRCIRSRERLPLGSQAEITTYQTRFEFAFAGDLGEKLQVFVGLYGPNGSAASMVAPGGLA